VGFHSALKVIAKLIFEIPLNLISAKQGPKSQWHRIEEAEQPHG